MSFPGTPESFNDESSLKMFCRIRTCSRKERKGGCLWSVEKESTGRAQRFLGKFRRTTRAVLNQSVWTTISSCFLFSFFLITSEENVPCTLRLRGLRGPAILPSSCSWATWDVIGIITGVLLHVSSHKTLIRWAYIVCEGIACRPRNFLLTLWL